MLALMKAKPEKGITLTETDKPVITDGEMLVRVHACGICGSDVHAYQWGGGYEWMEKHMPVTMGHEASGVVEEIGKDVTEFAIGDKVVCFPVEGCGECDVCKAGLTAICPSLVLGGYHKNGTFAKYVAIKPAGCVKLADDANLDVAALTEPLAIAQRAVSKAAPLLGKKVAIFGAGVIGMSATYFASVEHADVWVFAKSHDMPKSKAAKIFGAIEMINVDEVNTAEKTKEITNGQGFDYIFDCSGSPYVIKNAFPLLKGSGSVVTTGIYPSDITLDLNTMIRKEKSVITTYAYTTQSFEKIAHLTQTQPGLFENLITGVFPISEGLEAFEHAVRGDTIKVLVKP